MSAHVSQNRRRNAGGDSEKPLVPMPAPHIFSIALFLKKRFDKYFIVNSDQQEYDTPTSRISRSEIKVILKPYQEIPEAGQR